MFNKIKMYFTVESKMKQTVESLNETLIKLEVVIQKLNTTLDAIRGQNEK